MRRKEHLSALLRGALLSMFVLLGTLVASLLLEQAFHFGVVIRTAVFWLLSALGAGLLGWEVVRPLLLLLGVLADRSDREVAERVGRAYPGVRDRLVNILQLYHERDQATFYSAALIDASFEDLRRDIAPLDFTSVVDSGAARKASRLALVAVAAGAFLFAAFPSAFMGSAYRLWNHGEIFAAPPPFAFIVDPGDREVVKGDNVTVTVRITGQPQKEISLSSKPDGQTAYETRTLRPSADGSFRWEFPDIRFSTAYYAAAGDERSGEFRLSVADRPLVKLLRIQLVSPAYAQLPMKQLEDNIGEISALRGTVVKFLVESNKPLDGADVILNDGANVTLRVDGPRAAGELRLMKEGSYHIALKDTRGTANADPIEYGMKIVPDAYPTATILVPGANRDIAENVSLQILTRISDDFGFSRLRLAYKLVQSRYERPGEEFTFVTIPLPKGIGTEAAVPFTWDLARLSLVPEDVVNYYVEVFDNDDVSGPKSAASETYSLRLPSLNEVFSDVEKGHQESMEGLHQALQQEDEARKELEDLRQQMKTGAEKMDWQDQKKAEELLKKYQEVQKKIAEVNRTVNTMVEKMEKNRMLSNETLEKYQELQQLMDQINSPEFMEAMKRLQQSLMQTNPDALKQAMQQFKFSEENFRKSLERTLNLLKRIQIEQKLDEAVKRAGEVMKQEADLQQKTGAAKDQEADRLNELSRQQRDATKEMEELRKQLADLQKKMEEFPSEMPLAEMEAAGKEIDSSGVHEQMEQIAGQLQQQQTGQAMQNQAQVMQKMGRFMQQLRHMQQGLREKQQRQALSEMRRAMQDLLTLSQREEALKNESRNLDPNAQRFRENAQEQMDVLRDLGGVTGRMSTLSQKSFGITPEMGKSIGDAMRQMGGAMQSLGQRNGAAASQQQAGAMGSLNEAAGMLEGAMNSMMQGGGQGMGMAGLMQRLNSMTGMQQGINEGTRNLGALSMQQAADMARLAGEQGAVRKSLEDLAREAANTGELHKLLGDLNSIAQEMREVQTDLAQQNVTPETLRKQERIVSRMLDSERSMQERDYEKRRRSESGTTVAERPPGAIDLSRQEDRDRIRRDLLKALEEGYARDYQELIKKYFEVLEQSGTHNDNSPNQ